MKVINLIGGPNTGKSTTAFGLLYHLKKLGYKVEYAAEYAKEMVHENRSNILEDQLYILAKQNRRLLRLRDKCDYIVTDTSLLLNVVYDQGKHPQLEALAKTYFEGYENLIYYFPRNPVFAFDADNRVQNNHEESIWIDIATLEVLAPYKHEIIDTSDDYVSSILFHIEHIVGK